MTSLKIAIFHLAFIYSGGGEKLVLQEAGDLKKRGHKVSIFATVVDKKKSFPDLINKHKVKTFLPSHKFFKGHEAFQTVLSCMLAPFYAHRFRRYDVIFAANQPSLWIAWIVRRMYGVPYVSYLAQPTRFLYPRAIDKETGLFFTKKDSDSISARLMMTTFQRFSRWADTISVKGSTSILVNGHYIKEIIEKIYKASTVNCPSGVDVKKSVNKRKKYLLVTNRHFPQKKIEYAVFALQVLVTEMPDLKLYITGNDTEYTSVLKKLAGELGITDKIVFLGYQDEKQIGKLYRNASVYLYTAPEEDFGMGIIEAMSYGTPVVAWNSAGPSRIIEHGVSGLLAEPFVPGDFTGKIDRILSDKKLFKKLMSGSLKRVSAHYSLKKHMRVLEESLINASSKKNSI
jgi:glycosyltransferase involved in cell wall biosynthesis